MSFIDKTRHGAKEFIAEKVFLAHLLNFFSDESMFPVIKSSSWDNSCV